MTELVAVLAEGAVYEGHLKLQGRARIDGELRGGVSCDDFVEIGPRAHVLGDVDAPQVLVLGAVVGNVRARERVTLAATASVDGRIVTPWLDCRPGARLRAEVLVERTGMGQEP